MSDHDRQWAARYREELAKIDTLLKNGSIRKSEAAAARRALASPASRIKIFAEIDKEQPPAFAEFLLAAVTADKLRDAILGDYLEQFHRNCRSIGCARARRIYWAGVIRSLVPLVWSRLRDAGLVGLLFKYWSGG
jgi:hypothetical protein